MTLLSRIKQYEESKLQTDNSTPIRRRVQEYENTYHPQQKKPSLEEARKMAEDVGAIPKNEPRRKPFPVPMASFETMPEEIIDVGEKVKQKLGYDEPSVQSSKGIVGFNKRLGRGLVDLPIGFAATLAAAPRDIKTIIQQPKEAIPEVLKQTGEMLLAPVDPRNYTAEKLYEDPVGTAMNLAQLAGYGAVGSRGLKSFKSIYREKKPSLSASQMDEIAQQDLVQRQKDIIAKKQVEEVLSNMPKALPPANKLGVPVAARERVYIPEARSKTYSSNKIPEDFDVLTKQDQVMKPYPKSPLLRGFISRKGPVKRTVITEEAVPYPDQFSAGDVQRQYKPLKKEKPLTPYEKDIQVIESTSLEAPFSKETSPPKSLKDLTPVKNVESNLSLLKKAFATDETGAVGDIQKVKSDKSKQRTLEAEQARSELYNRAKNHAAQTVQSIEKVLADFGANREQMLAILSQGSVDNLKQISPDSFKDLRTYQTQIKNMSRAIEKVAGKDAPALKEKLVLPREQAVLNMTNEIAGYKNLVKQQVIDGLGIKPNTKEASAVMQYGEKRMTPEQLRLQFPRSWQNIVRADEFFRKQYDEILSSTNEVLRSLGKKEIPKRDDYYTHAQEIGNFWEDIMAPTAIDPQLVGVSQYTQPRMKWNPFAQKRTGSQGFVDDAIQAFDRYLFPTLSQKHVSPVMDLYQRYADNLATQTANTKHLNTFIEFLRDHSNALGGKTNPADRYLQDKLVGRKVMKIVDKASNQFAANTILGNIKTIAMQGGSLPMTLAETGPFNVAKGMFGTLSDALGGKSAAMELSSFLKRRYADISPIYKKPLQKVKNVVATPLSVVEQFVVESSWRANFEKAFSETRDVKKAAQMADEMTAQQIGDRSFGAKPLAFQSRLGNLLMQFQFEVNNQAQHLAHDIGLKNPGHLIKAFIYAHLMNEGFRWLSNASPLPDPIAAVKEGYASSKKEEKPLEKAKMFGGRLAGEVLSNIPLGQTIASGIPLNTRRKYFGDTEVGWFGGGVPLVSGAQRIMNKPTLWQAAEEALFTFGLPFGGSQIKKTKEGFKTIMASDGKLSSGDQVRALTLGPYASEELEKRTLKRKNKEKKSLKKQN